jgi:hypothetical protein
MLFYYILILNKPTCQVKIHVASELVGSCEHGNEPSGSIKGGEFLD